MSRLRIPAAWMRGGTSKGLFFVTGDLPADPAARDAILLRALGSPDPYGKQIDGLGGATSSTSKAVLVSRSTRPDCDVDYLFAQIPIAGTSVDWSGNCGNLTAAVGPFALARGLVAAPRDGLATVRIWQANIGKRIVARVPMADGEVQEDGDFVLDGVAFAAAEIALDFIDPAGSDEGGLFPTGSPLDRLLIADRGEVDATLINAGNPLVLVAAEALGLVGNELPAVLNPDRALLEHCEALRIAGALRMGLAGDAAAARARQHTPKLALLSRPAAFTAADGKPVGAAELDLNARVLSMGVFHHAIPGTAAIALAAAAAIPDTLAQRLLAAPVAGTLRCGHPSGRVEVGVEVNVDTRADGGQWTITRAFMSRSARLLMDGVVVVPASAGG
ncbi:MAG TPA: 2-methylaconitate cis-trans isomerase PrpF [Rhodocyclaceae bacterium]|nr:2-methylaconitate cis-trans isomerase PrpF [Rhodocyclaceae bacterium]